MIFDRTRLLSERQAILANTPSNDVFDLRAGIYGTYPTSNLPAGGGTVVGAAAPLKGDIGKGDPISLFVQVVETFTLLTSLKIELQVSNDISFATFRTLEEQTIPLARLQAGAMVSLNAIPPGANTSFLRLFYSPNGVAPGAGRITAGAGIDVQTAGVSY